MFKHKTVAIILALSLTLILPKVTIAGIKAWTNTNLGYSESVDISPNFANDKELYAATPNGIYKSSDRGRTWKQSGLKDFYAWGVDISPDYASDGVIYAGIDNRYVEEPEPRSFGGGIYKSIDRGRTWKSVGAIDKNISMVVISPTYKIDGTVLARIEDNGQHILKSTDRGQTWGQIPFPPDPGGIMSIALSPNFASDKTIFIGCCLGGFYRSTDGGATWNKVFDNTDFRSIVFSPNYAIDKTIFAADFDGYSSKGEGVYKSTDGGLTWSVVFRGNNDIDCALGISPKYASDKTVFVGCDSGIFRSTNGGANWTTYNNGLPATGLSSTEYCIIQILSSPNYGVDGTVFARTGGDVDLYIYSENKQRPAKSSRPAIR